MNMFPACGFGCGFIPSTLDTIMEVVGRNKPVGTISHPDFWESPFEVTLVSAFVTKPVGRELRVFLQFPTGDSMETARTILLALSQTTSNPTKTLLSRHLDSAAVQDFVGIKAVALPSAGLNVICDYGKEKGDALEESKGLEKAVATIDSVTDALDAQIAVKAAALEHTLSEIPELKKKYEEGCKRYRQLYQDLKETRDLSRVGVNELLLEDSEAFSRVLKSMTPPTQ